MPVCGTTQGCSGPDMACHLQDSAECMQQVQVTAFQSVQQESGALSPQSSGHVDSPMARALAASAAGGLRWMQCSTLTFPRTLIVLPLHGA